MQTLRVWHRTFKIDQTREVTHSVNSSAVFGDNPDCKHVSAVENQKFWFMNWVPRAFSFSPVASFFDGHTSPSFIETRVSFDWRFLLWLLSRSRLLWWSFEYQFIHDDGTKAHSMERCRCHPGSLKTWVADLRQTAVDDGNDSPAIVGSEQAPILGQSF